LGRCNNAPSTPIAALSVWQSDALLFAQPLVYGKFVRAIINAARSNPKAIKCRSVSSPGAPAQAIDTGRPKRMTTRDQPPWNKLRMN